MASVSHQPAAHPDVVGAAHVRRPNLVMPVFIVVICAIHVPSRTLTLRHGPGSQLRVLVLFGGGAGSVEGAGGGADVHVEGDADVGVPGQAGDVGGVHVPGEQGGGAEHVPQAVPGPGAVAAGVAPSGGEVGGGQDAAGEVGGAPVLGPGGGENQAQGVGPGLLAGAGLPDASGEALGGGVFPRRAAGGEGAPPPSGPVVPATQPSAPFT